MVKYAGPTYLGQHRGELVALVQDTAGPLRRCPESAARRNIRQHIPALLIKQIPFSGHVISQGVRKHTDNAFSTGKAFKQTLHGELLGRIRSQWVGTRDTLNSKIP